MVKGKQYASPLALSNLKLKNIDKNKYQMYNKKQKTGKIKIYNL